MYPSPSASYAQFVDTITDTLEQQAGFLVNPPSFVMRLALGRPSAVRLNICNGLQFEASAPSAVRPSDILMQIDLFKLQSSLSRDRAIAAMAPCIMELNNRQHAARVGYSSERATISLFQNVRIDVLSHEAASAEIRHFLDACNATIPELFEIETTFVELDLPIKFLLPDNFSASTEAHYLARLEQEGEPLDMSDWVLIDEDQNAQLIALMKRHHALQKKDAGSVWQQFKSAVGWH